MMSQQQQQSSQQFYDNFDKYCMDSANGDSGFLSGTSSTLNSCSFDYDSNNSHSMKSSSAQSSKNSENGINICLSENFDKLSLKQVSSSPLYSNKQFLKSNSQSDSGIIVSNKNEEEQWQLYFAQNEDGDTLLHTAIIRGFFEASLSLINIAPHSCLLDISNDDAQTALHLAVMTNQPEIVKKLIHAGADLTVRNREGNTALHLACIYKYLECARALTERGNSSQLLEQRNYNGETCLHIAASKNQLELVKQLIHAGADPEAQEYLAGRTALHLALEYTCPDVILYLVHECRLNLDIATYAGYTAYDIASCIDEQLARELIRYGATPPQKIIFQDSSNSSSNSSIPQIFATACGV